MIFFCFVLPVNCPPGTYSEGTTNVCKDCNAGFYQDEEGKTECQPCPKNTSSVITGSKSKADCKRKMQVSCCYYMCGLAVSKIIVFTSSTVILLTYVTGRRTQDYGTQTSLLLPPFSLIRDFGKQNTRGNVSKISVSLAWYRQIGSRSTNHSH